MRHPSPRMHRKMFFIKEGTSVSVEVWKNGSMEVNFLILTCRNTKNCPDFLSEIVLIKMTIVEFAIFNYKTLTKWKDLC
jgi:hypothetical protein